MPMQQPTYQTRLRSPEPGQLGFWETTTGQRSPYHPVWHFFARQRSDFVNTIVPLQQVASVVDLGCGRGIASVYFEQSDKRLVRSLALAQARFSAPEEPAPVQTDTAE
jgi:hypothetical protein